MFAPELGVVGEEFAEGCLDLAGLGSEGSNLVAFKKLDVSFLLPGDDVVDEHGAFGGDGFVHGGASGLPDDKVMGGKELWDFTGPTLDFHATGELVFDFTGLFVEAAKVSSEDDGDFSIVFQDGPNDVADVG